MTSKTTHITAALVGALVALLIVFATGQIKEPATSLIDELLAVDRAFSEIGRTEGVDRAFGAYASEDILWFLGDGPARGREVIIEAASAWGPGTLVWMPEGGEVSADGMLGYTWGPYSVTASGEETVLNRGYYLTVWRKDGDGDWKVIADIGNVVEDAEAQE